LYFSVINNITSISKEGREHNCRTRHIRESIIEDVRPRNCALLSTKLLFICLCIGFQLENAVKIEEKFEREPRSAPPRLKHPR